MLSPRKSLNEAFLKIKPHRAEIDHFKTNLSRLLDITNNVESEEFHKNLVIDFLKKTYYDPNHFVNTKGRNDLVIHNGDKPSSTVGVIIEAKSPTNKSDMVTSENLNAKAFQELVLYYLRERITQKNNEVKHLIITNINEWFVFDVTIFDRLFAQNKNFVKQFTAFEGKRLADYKTSFFYTQIAAPFIAEIKAEIEFTHFNLQEYQKPLLNDDKADDKKLINLFKILSPEHLLKQPFTNDSNSLDKRFYTELLHIIGLAETKEGSKKLIGRNPKVGRNTGSILEDTIIQLDSLDKINRLERPTQYGKSYNEQLFNISLELSITWINRVLFLKLLEAQLVSYHKGDKSFSFLNIDVIKNYDDLNGLFFQVLAKKHADRNQDVKQQFGKVPYLNSSLFEPSEIEQSTIFISNLKDEKFIPILPSTVIKNEQGKKRVGNISTLEYLFKFLDAYDFSSEGTEEIQEENKTLINASVLGLIFEKINGYKDGSYFTPGFITMHICRETVRKAVVNKFNEVKKWKCDSIEEIDDKIEPQDRGEANDIINSLRICDPAVGSGHFLVSALNEIIAIKHDLKILQDRRGNRLKHLSVKVINDELIITDEDNELFEYNPKFEESQNIQETIFHEKQMIIENCLFGVDINPNSVKICRLRLWIELLKNTYYKNQSELETLPNIDINIKCGNSLISRFELDADIGDALKNSKWSIDSYRAAVDTYRNAKTKVQKHAMEELILDIKSDFRSEISMNDPMVKRFHKLNGEVFLMKNQTSMFEMSKKEQNQWNKKLTEISSKATKLEKAIDEINNNKIFENAFEWRFEFPEILNNSGDFIGFDAIIGNPPYIFSRELITEKEKTFFYKNYSLTQFKLNTYVLFSELAYSISKNDSIVSYIIPNNWLTLENNSQFREFILTRFKSIEIVNDKNKTFEDASVDASIITLSKSTGGARLKAYELTGKNFDVISETESANYLNSHGSIINYQLYADPIISAIIDKINTQSDVLDAHFEVKNGVQAYTVGEGIPTQTREMKDNRIYHSKNPQGNDWVKYVDGSDIVRYKFNWSGQYIKYGANLSRRRIPDLFRGERIYVRQIPSLLPYAIVSAIIEIDAVCDNNHMVIRSKDDSFVSLAALNGILNSKLMSFWFSLTFAKHQRKIFPQFKVKELKTFPIPKKNNPIIIAVAEKVHELYKTRDSELEVDIDYLVYELFDIAADEIKIIESIMK